MYNKSYRLIKTSGFPKNAKQWVIIRNIYYVLVCTKVPIKSFIYLGALQILLWGLRNHRNCNNIIYVYNNLGTRSTKETKKLLRRD